MIIVKLFVLLCCVNGFSASPTDFCKICLNHTLCKYKTQGPSPSCKFYDSSALLTSEDTNELVNKINERRSFVALGYSKFLPQAADMKRIHWSSELATVAQRWVDQCDPSIRPDKEDQCRDLENVNVGQNIGSVLGTSPGLSVKGFVEMWFIQVLDFAGSVSYYNKFQDYKTSYLTQLIWANTEFVGCGKAKFYVDERNVMLERLVCNFAPKGNTHGKPVYSIGYPGTQCKNNMIPDDKYKGLCNHEDDAIFTKLTTPRRPVNSLLRILNLSNDSVKQHIIDPIRNNIKQNNVNSNSSNEQRNQKTRHIFSNKSYATVKHIPQLRQQMFGHGFMNFSGNNNDHYQHDRGHSHLYHGHDMPRYNYETTTVINFNQDFTRYVYTPVFINAYSNTNYRRFSQYAQCTRRMRPTQDICVSSQVSNQCSRAPDDCYQQTIRCPSTCTDVSCTQLVEDHTYSTSYIPPLPDPCACTQLTRLPISNYNTNCPCSLPRSTNTCCLTTICPEVHRLNNDFNDYKRAGSFQHYDIIPNVVVRSGNHKKPQENSSQKGKSFVMKADNSKSHKTIYEEKYFDQIHKDMTDYPKHKSQDRDYLYRSFDSGFRKRRQLEDEMTVKPFWQIENFNYQKPPQLKSMRYTTLLNKKNRKTRKNTDSLEWLTSTEPITLKLADYAELKPEHVTEKYLSFDELLHLRKISDGYAQYDLRRKGKTTAKGTATTKDATKPASKNPTKAKTKKGQTTKAAGNSTKKTTKTTITTKTHATTKTAAVQLAEKTTEYTANTPFERKKHCTRKLTCTWTALTGNEDAKVFGNIEIGSRTPPGYVEGCSRTSTCTRDYMDRNKISTLPDENFSESKSPEDEDYCERRSLNVQRRHSDTKTPTALLVRYLDYTDSPIITAEINVDPVSNSYKESVTESVLITHDCICNEKYARKKEKKLNTQETREQM